MVYGLAARRQGGGKQAVRAALYMGVGFFSFAIPFLVLWGVPNLPYILEHTSLVRASSNKIPAWQAYSNYYHVLLTSMPWALLPVSSSMMSILAWLGYPLAMTAPLLLLFWRQARVFLLAALPHVLFMGVFVPASARGSVNYYVPEYILSFAAFLALALAAASWLAARTLPKRTGTVIAALLCCLTAAAVLADGLSNDEFHYAPNRSYLPLARAAAKEMVGGENVVGITCGAMWYVGGGVKVVNLVRDLIYPKDISGFDPGTFFEPLDAVVEYAGFSHITYNRQRKSLISFLNDGLLHVGGFYFYGPGNRAFGYLILKSKAPETKVGFAQLGRRLFKFSEDPDGEFVFSAWRWPSSKIYDNTLAQIEFMLPYGLPPDHNGQPPKQSIFAFLMPKGLYRQRHDDFAKSGPKLAEFCTSKEEMDPALFMADLDKDDEPIVFAESMGHLHSLLRVGVPLVLVPGPDKKTLDLSPRPGVVESTWPMGRWKAYLPPGQLTMKRTDGGWAVSTDYGRWSYVAGFGPLRATQEGEYRFELDYRLSWGGLAFGALDAKQSKWQARATGPWYTETRDLGNYLTKSFSMRLKKGQVINLLVSNDFPGFNFFSVFELLSLRGYLVKPSNNAQPVASAAKGRLP